MPPTIRFTRQSVLDAAYQLVRREGLNALNARAVARELGGSTQPIFRLFSGMDELYHEVIKLADENIRSRMHHNASESNNAYISVCMTYLLFARDEPELFKLLFMRDRVSDGSCGREYKHEWGFPVIQSSFGVDRETAEKLYERSFFHTHGLAVCIATKYMPCMDEAHMEALVTQSLKAACTQLGIQSDSL
ncbi:MAG: TetR/AcrR family transcriptional regulator [Clostridia bacterium]|nr:TetR/AcrR family transcriptional regulator [Clostridia bacterium]